DARHCLHFLIGRVAAEVGRDDCGLAQHLRHQRIGAAAEGRREDRAILVDDENVGLTLMGTQLVDLVLELPSRLIHCRVCKEPFAPTDEDYVLKYFLVDSSDVPPTPQPRSRGAVFSRREPSPASAFALLKRDVES